MQRLEGPWLLRHLLMRAVFPRQLAGDIKSSHGFLTHHSLNAGMMRQKKKLLVHDDKCRLHILKGRHTTALQYIVSSDIVLVWSFMCCCMVIISTTFGGLEAPRS